MMTNQSNEEKLEILINDAHGVYIPQLFINEIDIKEWHITSEHDINTLKSGPDNELYWDSWDQVLNNAYCIENGKKWTLIQDGDLWAVRDDYDWENDTCFTF